jgi:hypothetical protein
VLLAIKVYGKMAFLKDRASSNIVMELNSAALSPTALNMAKAY